MCLYDVCVCVGVDTGVVDKESNEYRPGFMQHFDQKEEAKKKVGGRSKAPQGPHDISFYFPDIPEGMEFRDFVSFSLWTSIENLWQK